MKFNKTLEAGATELPVDWRPYLINYKGLKKNIKSIVRELVEKFPEYGGKADSLTVSSASAAIELDDLLPHLQLADPVMQDITPNSTATSAATVPNTTAAGVWPASVAVTPSIPVTRPKSPQLSSLAADFTYQLKVDGNVAVRPTLVLHPLATSPPPPPAEIGALTTPEAAGPQHPPIIPSGDPLGVIAVVPDRTVTLPIPRGASLPDPDTLPGSPVVLKSASATEVILQSDAAFFDAILGQLARTEGFQRRGEADFYQRLSRLESALARAASPYGPDLYTWRAILGLYQDMAVWRQRQGETNAETSAARAKQRLQLFAQTLVVRQLAGQFRAPASAAALGEFVNLNIELLTVKTFRALNQTALTKILKKHDKRTHLRATPLFSDMLQAHSRRGGQLAGGTAPALYYDWAEASTGALVFALVRHLVAIVPQPDEYACPLCLAVYYQPLRLTCGHVYCLHCLIRANRQRITDCPLCRRPGAILEATREHLDPALHNFLNLYFPREAKRRRRAIDRENARRDVQAVLAPHVWTADVAQMLGEDDDEEDEGSLSPSVVSS
ncbi:hypothetical protein IWQ60_003290 [Tieghemiomyces parasiticus]|uniref:RING-type domain-containing protein n=1 Tax=Tieghemiomyces parasiticus TaxID=78921 RepID=A0A9W8E0C4_9FUNG|nr:hypothetical protein IWQ60_003290 [Tieghemiomyces parasiticus]